MDKVYTFYVCAVQNLNWGQLFIVKKEETIIIKNLLIIDTYTGNNNQRF